MGISEGVWVCGLQPGQLATVLELFALRYGVMFALAGALLSVTSGALSINVLVPMVAVMTAPVPLLTLAYAVEFDCNAALAAWVRSRSLTSLLWLRRGFKAWDPLRAS